MKTTTTTTTLNARMRCCCCCCRCWSAVCRDSRICEFANICGTAPACDRKPRIHVLYATSVCSSVCVCLCVRAVSMLDREFANRKPQQQQQRTRNEQRTFARIAKPFNSAMCARIFWRCELRVARCRANRERERKTERKRERICE